MSTTLTTRERQVAALAAEGVTSRAIAMRLHVSKRTVDTHMTHVLSKLGVSDRTQLAAALQGDQAHPAAAPARDPRKASPVTLAEIKRRVKPGQQYLVINHQRPALSPLRVVVDRKTGDYGFYVKHALGESKVNWPPARHVTRDEDGTLHLRTAVTGTPYLTLMPVTVTEEGESGNG